MLFLSNLIPYKLFFAFIYFHDLLILLILTLEPIIYPPNPIAFYEIS